MPTQIRIDQLKVGMRIEKMDRSWLSTPFLRHRMTVTSSDQIAQLRACGVKVLEVTYEEAPIHAESAELTVDEAPVAPEAEPVQPESTEPLPEPIPFTEELPVARQVYLAAKSVIEEAMHDVRMGRAINMDAVNQVVADMAKSAVRNPDALTSLSRLKNFDEYTFYHSVNTSVLALSLGRSMGMNQATLHRLGVGSLLHDIGKTKIPLEILNKPGKFEPHEFEIMKQHAMRGVEVLSGTTGLTDEYVRPALEHHERVDGTGYPYGRSREELSQFGLISAVVDIYDAITSERCYHKAKPAHEALQFLYMISQKGHLEHTLVQRFIQIVGVYPVGSVVALNTGEIAVVRRVNRDAPLMPEVLIVKSDGNTLLSNPETVDLACTERSRRRSIVRVIDQGSVNINPVTYLDPEAA